MPTTPPPITAPNAAPGATQLPDPSANKMPKTIRFGIPTLDELLSSDLSKPGIDISTGNNKESDVASVCIIGPDGTGKSVLAMHIAAHYAADNFTACHKAPRILYVSTDLRYRKAHRVWTNFMLEDPLKRPIPFCTPDQKSLPIEFKECVPNDNPEAGQISLKDYLYDGETSDGKPVIAFVNLAAYTAGDDWSYLNHALATMDKRGTECPKDMVIIDAVEGLETLVGEQDAYGETRSRRARIAQFVRVASEKCHTALIVEEEREDIRQPEDYVTDVVIRLRTVEVRDKRRSYVRRTVEIEKGRAQKHARGQHNFVIRSGQGSTTGEQQNPDDPRVVHPEDKYKYEVNPKDESIRNVSYIHVFHSLDFLNRQIMETRGKKIDGACSDRFAGFGIPHLDEMLAYHVDKNGKKQNVSVSDPESDDQGLPCSSVTALIGETGTHKNRLANAFLSQCFLPDKQLQVAVLITTHDVDAHDLAKKISRHIKPKYDALPLDKNGKARQVPSEKDIMERIVCRRLEVHDISSATLFHIIREAIWEARRKVTQQIPVALFNDRERLLESLYPSLKPHGIKELECLQREDLDKLKNHAIRQYGTELRHAYGKYVRVVISNLALMSSTYADVEDDSEFLPALQFYLGREGVTSLLVHTEDGGPNSPQISDFTRAVRNGVRHHLYTWHVPFYGEDRIAIAPQPPISDQNPAVVRELHCKEDAKGKKDDELLEVNPHFEIYTGLLEKQTPRLVPLQVRLLGGPGRFQNYAAHVNHLFKELFADMRVEGDIVSVTPKEDYETLFSLNNLQGDTRLERTVVMQVDSFWVQHYSSLHLMKDYLEAHTVDEQGSPVRTNDPYLLFQNTLANANNSQAKRRYQFFDTTGYDYSKALAQNNYSIDRVPFTWDFGFLLLREAAWKRAYDRQFKVYQDDGKLFSVYDVWKRLTHSVKDKVMDSKIEKERSERQEQSLSLFSAFPEEEVALTPTPKPVSWREFLHACSIVARSQGAEQAGYPHPFDVDMLARATFVSLVLEIWASEIYARNDPKQNLFAEYRHDTCDFGLIKMLEENQIELYRTWLLLGEVLSPDQFGSDGLAFESRSFHQDAIASRHWYSTATCAQEDRSREDPLIPVRLPGHYSVRGDWFLAIARGSRSPRLGERAIDLLSSRRANVMRLQEGIGLPTRDFLDDGTNQHVWTRLYHYDENGAKRPITYGEVRGIGSPTAKNADEQRAQSEDEFFWLWRYSLQSYARHSRMFLKMQSRLLCYWRDWMKLDERTKQWRSGFEFYDNLKTKSQHEELASYKEFKKECDLWLAGLKSSTISGIDPTNQQAHREQAEVEQLMLEFQAEMGQLTLEL